MLTLLPAILLCVCRLLPCVLSCCCAPAAASPLCTARGGADEAAHAAHIQFGFVTNSTDLIVAGWASVNTELENQAAGSQVVQTCSKEVMYDTPVTRMQLGLHQLRCCDSSCGIVQDDIAAVQDVDSCVSARTAIFKLWCSCCIIQHDVVLLIANCKIAGLPQGLLSCNSQILCGLLVHVCIPMPACVHDNASGAYSGTCICRRLIYVAMHGLCRRLM